MTASFIENNIAVARNERPADLTIRNAEVFNVFTGLFTRADVLVADDRVAAVLPLNEGGSSGSLPARDTVEGTGCRLVPGFINAHVHIESSHLCPEEFTGVLAACGVTAVIADPHEVCNVMGLAGLEYMINATEDAPARVYFMLPSCVPASPLDTAAHTLAAEDLLPWLEHPRVIGLGEMMNYPGLLHRSPDVMAKLETVHRLNVERFGALRGLSIDGHAPLVNGRDLQAYVAAGVSSDHEASTVAEASERLALGMGLMMREGSSVKNLLDLIPALTPSTFSQCMLCTDDRHVGDLLELGCINYMVRLLAEDGRLPLADILRMAGWNTARHFSLAHTGAIAPGYKADFALYPNPGDWKPSMVWQGGRLVAENGRPVAVTPRIVAHEAGLRNTVRIASLDDKSLAVPDPGGPVKVIGAIPRQIITQKLEAVLPSQNGMLTADPAQDIAKLAVFERHTASGRVGRGFVKGMGLARGALASTVSHDTHNLIVLGMNDADMLLAARALQEAGGGQIACLGGKILALLRLPLAGLLSDAPAAEVLAEQRKLHETARELGAAEGIDPFMTLAFMGLSVIPSLKLTDCGLVDVDAFAFTALRADAE